MTQQNWPKSSSGLPLKPEGEVPVFDTYLGGQKIAPLANLSEDVSLVARNATLNMIDFLVKTKGLTREQAYVLNSVAVDLTYIGDHIAVLAGGRHCASRPGTARAADTHVFVTITWTCPIDPRDLRYRVTLFQDVDPAARHPAA